MEPFFDSLSAPTLDYPVPPPTSASTDHSPESSSTLQAHSEPAPDTSRWQLGKYRIEETLGRGGQGTVYRAYDPDLRRHVVLKLFHDTTTPRVREQVFKEGQALARVSSPNVARCYGVEHSAFGPFLVVEHVPGRSLAQLLRERSFSTPEALALMAQVARGLADVHRAGLLHRDIKPSNILVGEDGVARLIDFGLVEEVAGDDLKNLAGTPSYMAPEQARRDAKCIGPLSDLYSLGAVLWRLLTGKTPCSGRALPAEDLKRLPRSVVEICRRCLATQPAERFADAEELRRALLRARARLSARTRIYWSWLPLLALGVSVAAFLFWQASRTEDADYARAPMGHLRTHTTRPAPSPCLTPPATVEAEQAPPAPQTGPEETSVDDADDEPLDQPQPITQNDSVWSPLCRPLRADFPVKAWIEGKKKIDDSLVSLAPCEKVELTVQPGEACYVSVWLIGKHEPFRRIFPTGSGENLVAKGQQLVVPNDSNFTIRIKASAGDEYFYVLARRKPLLAPNALHHLKTDRAHLLFSSRQFQHVVERARFAPCATAEAVVRFRVAH